MKVICENYKKCDEPCLHRNPHDSNSIEQKSCRANQLFCVIAQKSLSCFSVEDFKKFPVIHNPLFEQKVGG